MAERVQSWEQRIAGVSESATGVEYRILLDGIAQAETEGLLGPSEARELRRGLEQKIVSASKRFESDQQPQSSLELLQQTIQSAPEDMRRVLISELDGICVRLWRSGRERNGRGDLEAAERVLMLAERVAAAHRDVAGEVSGENERRMRSITEQVFAVQLKIAIATSRSGGRLDANLKEQLRERLAAASSRLALLGRVVLLAADLDSGGSSAVAPELKQFATQNEALVKGCVSNTALKALGL